jgi:hypothetical protein
MRPAGDVTASIEASQLAGNVTLVPAACSNTCPPARPRPAPFQCFMAANRADCDVAQSANRMPASS